MEFTCQKVNSYFRFTALTATGVPDRYPLPEVYYYKFDHPQGFGGAFIGDNVFKVADGSAACIPGGLTHPQTAAPGYNMYYCWMIRHLEISLSAFANISALLPLQICRQYGASSNTFFLVAFSVLPSNEYVTAPSKSRTALRNEKQQHPGQHAAGFPDAELI